MAAGGRELRALGVLLCCLLSAALSSVHNTTQTCPAYCPPCSPCPVCPTCTRAIPAGYIYYPGIGHYRLHSTPSTWMDAKDTCELEGAYLAVINSQEEAELMEKFIKTMPGGGQFLWIGFHDLYKEGVYRTVLGQYVSETGYNVWFPGEPNNNFNNENCGAYQSGGLNDLMCEYVISFVCEVNVQTLAPLG